MESDDDHYDGSNAEHLKDSDEDDDVYNDYDDYDDAIDYDGTPKIPRDSDIARRLWSV